MGSSTQKTSQTSVGPGKSQLAAAGPGRIEEQYQADLANPNRLAPQASSWASSVLRPEFADPRNNPYFEGALQDTLGRTQLQAQSMFGRAGRGNSNNASGVGGYFADTATRALAPTLASMYQQNLGLQSGVAGMAGAIDATQSLPLEQYLERMRSLATLDQQGKTTVAQPIGQTIAGLGLTAAGMFGKNGFNVFG